MAPPNKVRVPARFVVETPSRHPRLGIDYNPVTHAFTDTYLNPRGYAIEWIGDRNDVAPMASRVSPLTYVRAGAPPVFTIHGDADKLVPVAHARRLHEALLKAGARSELLILPGAGHGDFNAEQVRQSDDAVRAFLTKLGIIK